MSLWIEDTNDLKQARTVLFKQAVQLGFKLDLFFQTAVVFERFKLSQLGGSCCSSWQKFCKARQVNLQVQSDSGMLAVRR